MPGFEWEVLTCGFSSGHLQSPSPTWVCSVLYSHWLLPQLSWEFVGIARTQGDDKDSTEVTGSCEPEEKLFIEFLMLSTALISRITHHQGPHRITKTKPSVFQNTRWYPSCVPKSQARAGRRQQEQNKAGMASLPGSVHRMDIFGETVLVFRKKEQRISFSKLRVGLPPWASSSHSRVLELFLYFFCIPPSSKIESKNMPWSI